MRAELVCEDVRVELSARLDDEVDAATARALDEHLATCARCRAHEAQLARVRSAVRVQPVDAVPDLADAIMARIGEQADRERGRDEWHKRLRVGAISAAAAALVLLGTTAPWRDRMVDTAAASDISREIRAAARALSGYSASYRVVERGWHRAIDERSFAVEVLFEAPERFSLTIHDLTDYPKGRWPANEVRLISNGRRWWIREPSSCPVAALPCTTAPGAERFEVAPSVEERSIVRRQPFDGTSGLPTDMILPVETLSASRNFEVLGRDEVLGRATYRIALSYRQAVPLLQSLQPGGSWRPFHPLDPVEIWIDEETWFPLRFEVRAGSSPDRVAWSQRHGLAREAAGSLLLRVDATDFSQPTDIDDDEFDPPVSGTVRRGGFRALTSERLSELPSLAGLEPYRLGRTKNGTLEAYARGMTWLKVERVTAATGNGSVPLVAQEIPLGRSRVYYRPADETFKRRIDIFGPRKTIHLESNLSRADLLDVAREMGVRGVAQPIVLRSEGLTIRRLEPPQVTSVGFAATPRYLPEGYPSVPTTALLTRTLGESSTLTLYYQRPEAEYEGFGVRITQSPRIEFLPPSSEEHIGVRLGAVPARWSPERGELEWIDRGVYRAVAVPAFDLATAVRIARGLQ